LEVSADTLRVDVVDESVVGVSSELVDTIKLLPARDQKRLMNIIKAYIEG